VHATKQSHGDATITILVPPSITDGSHDKYYATINQSASPFACWCVALDHHTKWCLVERASSRLALLTKTTQQLCAVSNQTEPTICQFPVFLLTYWWKKFEAIELEGELVAEWLAFVDGKSQLKGKVIFLVCFSLIIFASFVSFQLLVCIVSFVMMSGDLCSSSYWVAQSDLSGICFTLKLVL